MCRVGLLEDSNSCGYEQFVLRVNHFPSDHKWELSQVTVNLNRINEAFIIVTPLIQHIRVQVLGDLVHLYSFIRLLLI